MVNLIPSSSRACSPATAMHRLHHPSAMAPFLQPPSSRGERKGTAAATAAAGGEDVSRTRSRRRHARRARRLLDTRSSPPRARTARRPRMLQSRPASSATRCGSSARRQAAAIRSVESCLVSGLHTKVPTVVYLISTLLGSNSAHQHLGHHDMTGFQLLLNGKLNWHFLPAWF